MIRKTISYIISFILVLLLLAIIMFQVFYTTILNKDYVEKEINKSDYYEKLSETINEKFKNYIMQSGMEEVIFEGLYTRETLRNDFEKVLDAVYNNKELEIDTIKIREKLDENIKKYASENDIQITVSNSAQITAFEDTIIENYILSIQYSKTGINYLAKGIEKIKTYLNPVKYAVIASFIVLTIVLILINIKEKKKALSYMGITLLAVGGLIIAVLIYEKINLNIENSEILDENLSVLIRLLVRKIFKIFYIISGTCFISGILFSIMGNKEKNDSK